MRKYLFTCAALLFAASASAQPGPTPATAPYMVGAPAGPVVLTGTTNETNMAALKIPANTIGKNGMVQVFSFWSYTNSSNVKTMQTRYTSTAGATTGGPLGLAMSVTTTATVQGVTYFYNNNAANSQVFSNVAATTPFGASPQLVQTSAVDTTQDSYINLNAQLALGTETLTLQHAYAVVYPQP